jgi:2-(1,2-epoxy-1,2-dihydrophenyl)acetyl-CoA isomerase
MTYAKIKLDLADNIALITLNDPSTLNAAGMDLMADLADAIVKISTGEIACRAVVLTGEGRGFCSGANLATRGKTAVKDTLGEIYNPFIRALRDLPVPLVTAVNGPAAGIGSSFALMGDIIVCSEDAFFLQAFRRIGLVPDGGATWMLPRLIGKARAMELALLGEKLPARTALEWGMVNRVVPAADLLPTAMDLARNLADGPASLGMIRQLVWEGMAHSHDAQLEAERHMQAKAGATADSAEGVSAFLEKRPARFTGA